MRSLQDSTFRAVASKILEDDILSEDEEGWLNAVSEVLGVTDERFCGEFNDLLNRLVIARVNDGRLPVLETPHIMTKKGETVHGETNAQLMKEVALREYRGGYSGFSFRITKGVRYHVGGARGHSVVVGTKLLAEDNGILSITSQRAVFLGSKKTIELPYSKLLNLGVFTDGIQFHMSNRTAAPLFALGNGEVIAAMVNGAAQRLS